MIELSDHDLTRLADLIAPRLAALLGAGQAAAAQLVTKQELAARWRVSGATIDRMVRAGMPVERVTGDAPRFDVSACDLWRRDRPLAVAAPVGDAVDMAGVRALGRKKAG